MSARTPLAHGGALAAREQRGEAANVVSVLLHALLVDGLAARPPGGKVEPRLGLEGDQPLDRQDGDAAGRRPVFDEQPVVFLVEQDRLLVLT
ncbi:hypothetical protein [uncultured Senegalimassilia sp.]|uniref:hypothetical protein n=1 Tax=uncultured Senegalimassilia sp. TaxID=1714350 RepID=UPI0026DEBAE4|nr:hypothetical protein [uncultured Senegalimassilia sp.]